MSILDKDSPDYQQLITHMQTSWIYRSLAWVTPAQAGWVFCGSALLTVIFLFLAINVDNPIQYTFAFLFMVMLSITGSAGIFGVVSWLYDRYIKDEKSRINARYGLHFGIFCILFLMGLTILQSLH
jgi:uncharacterized membrane protein (DUF4010 family)